MTDNFEIRKEFIETLTKKDFVRDATSGLDLIAEYDLRAARSIQNIAPAVDIYIPSLARYRLPLYNFIKDKPRMELKRIAIALGCSEKYLCDVIRVAEQTKQDNNQMNLME